MQIAGYDANSTWYRNFYVYGIYIVDVSKATKNKISKEDLGDYDIVLIYVGRGQTSQNGSSRFTSAFLPLLGNLSILTYDNAQYYSAGHVASIYGCSTNDIQEYSLDTFSGWLENYLLQKVSESNT